MDQWFKRGIIAILLLWALGLISFFFAHRAYSHNETQGYSVIAINNPFKINVKVRLKCNWNGKKWEIDRSRKLNGKTKIIEQIPNNSNCQIWPYR